jgi:hypothetical protein
MVQLSATRCSCIDIMRVSLVRFASMTLYIASHWVLIFVSVYVVIDSVRKLLDTASYVKLSKFLQCIRLSYSDTSSFRWLCHSSLNLDQIHALPTECCGIVVSKFLCIREVPRSIPGLEAGYLDRDFRTFSQIPPLECSNFSYRWIRPISFISFQINHSHSPFHFTLYKL